MRVLYLPPLRRWGRKINHDDLIIEARTTLALPGTRRAPEVGILGGRGRDWLFRRPRKGVASGLVSLLTPKFFLRFVFI
jgi:hypothetical protein